MLFFGTEEFSSSVLQRLLDAGFSIEAVITKPDTPSGRGHKVVPPAVKVIAEEHGIRVLQPANLLDIADDVKAYGKPVGVLASYGKIVPQAILDLFEPGIINVHPSLLPTYRGPSPIETAILDGLDETGVSIIKLVAKMDAGPIYAQEKAPVMLPAEEAYSYLANIGANLLISSLPAILNGSLQPTEQAGEPTYTKLIQKSDGIIDWHKSAAEIEHQINAYHEWPQSRANIGKMEVIITAAHAVPFDFGGEPGEFEAMGGMVLNVATDDGYICVEALKPLGKKEMPVKAFLQGYLSQL